MKSVMVILMCLCLCSCATAPAFDKTDKYLFATLIAAQATDGLTTVAGLERGDEIHRAWSWKYGTSTPSTELLWAVKSAEIVGAYYAASVLPSRARKVFLSGTALLLFSCALNNGLHFSLTY